MLLVVDNGSVYTKDLTGFLDEKDITFERQNPNTVNLYLLDNFDSFILSGRKHNDKRTNMVNSQIVLHAIATDKKLLGICYGAEILALTLGGTIKRSTRLWQGDQKITIRRSNPLCADKISVFESHRFEISRLPERLISLGTSENCKHEMICYGQQPIFGTQFHPEMSTDGRRMIERFCLL